jgi:hypothetical protein
MLCRALLNPLKLCFRHLRKKSKKTIIFLPYVCIKIKKSVALPVIILFFYD